jgi:ribonucleoside-diphosphate reductase alpha chain
MSDLFMDRLATGGKFDLVDPRSGKVARSVLAQELFDRLAQAAWETGDPGVVFLDRMNRFNPTPRAGAFESTNPCGEQPLLPFESCNLGSLNLSCYWSGDRIDWPLLARDVWSSVRFLDAVIDVNQYPVIECKKITLRNRKIGLGVMGFADLLLLMGLAYDSLEGRDQGERLMSFINREAKAASAELARRKGAFPNWRGSLWQNLGYPQLRNATVSTVAPTGTISIIAGCSSGIEPVFAGTFERNVLSGRKLRQTHTLSTRSGKAWRTAMEISVEDHVKMQAVFQRHSDSAVSKTINMPKSATVEQVKKAYLLAYQLGCKGITVYRDQCRKDQVLVESPVCDTCVD